MNSAEENKKITSEEYYKTVKDSDVLTELRNGEITAMSSPGIEHQTIVSEMFFAISSYIRKWVDKLILNTIFDCKSFTDAVIK